MTPLLASSIRADSVVTVVPADFRLESQSAGSQANMAADQDVDIKLCLTRRTLIAGTVFIFIYGTGHKKNSL